jgi:hypothetical protein
MSATATKAATTTESKTKTKSKKTSAAKIEANCRNSWLSKGPTSADGKARSRYNALKHGMTAKTVLLPGDDPQEFSGRLRYLQDDLQARNSLEAVVIERLAGDLWKSDRSDRSFCNRINFRLRHESDDQARKDADEAVELGQHLLWQPEFPLPVGALEGEVKGALAKFPLADVPGDPKHPARLLLKLQATVAGCDWLLKRWDELRFRLENGGPWAMDDVWKMVRLLGKTAIEMKDDFQVALLVLASLALEPEPVRKLTFAESMIAMSRNDGLSRIVDGITRLCEPFQRALARMPLDKLAPENEAQARQRLSAVVEEELGRIGRIRVRLQKIADADLAGAPVRLAFETGTEGDRQRRYVLSYERLVNRRIDTFLKVRKASGSGELDLIELQQSTGADKLRELIVDAGIMTSPDPGDLRSGDGRGRETRAQHEETLAQHEETVGQPPGSVNGGLGSKRSARVKGSARVSDPAATPDRRSPVLESTNASTPPAAAQSDNNAELPSVSLVPESVCDDNMILRNEATAEPDDQGGWRRLPQGDAPGADATAPGARWTSQLDPSHPALATDQGVDLQPSPQHETTAAPDDPPSQAAEGCVSDGDPEDLRSDDGRGRESRPLPVLPGKWDMPRVHTNHIPLQESLPLPVSPGKWDMPRVHTNHIPLQETRTRYEETLGQPPASANGLGSGSARVSDPAGTPDRRSPGSGLPSTTPPAPAQSDNDAELPAVSRVSKSACDDDSILRNEATAAPDDLGGWGRLPQGDAPGAEAAAPGARWTSQLDPSHPALVTDQGAEVQPFAHEENNGAPARAEPDDPGGRGRLPQGDAPGAEAAAPGAELAPTDVAPVARAPTDVQRSRPRLTPEQELFNWRLKRYRAMRGLPPL